MGHDHLSIEVPDAQAQAAGPEWTTVAALVIILTVALLLRVYQIGEQELWFDEAFSFHVATLSSGLGQALRLENTPPLYYLLLRAWIPIAGTSEAAVRMVSAISSTLFVLAVFWAGMEFFNRRVALWSSLFAAIAPVQIYYAQEARAYALAAATVLAAHVLLWRALQRQTVLAWLAFCLVALAALYTHYFTLIALLPTAVLVWAHAEGSRRREAWRAYGLAVLACALLYLPWLIWCFVLYSHPYDFAGWMEEAWAFTPPSLAIPKSLEVQGLGSQAGAFPPFAKVFRALHFPPRLRVVGLGALAMLGICAAVRWGDRALAIPRLKRLKVWLWTLLLFPLAVMWMLSFVKPSYIVGRQDILVSPAYALLVGFALAKLQAAGRIGWVLTPVAVLALFIPIGVKLALYYQTASIKASPGEAQTAAALDQFVKNGDVVVLSGMRSLEVLYYLHRRGYRWEAGQCSAAAGSRQFGCRLLPLTYERSLGYDPRVNQRVSDSAGEISPGLLGTMDGQNGSLWMVLDAGAFAHSRTQEPEFLSVLADELSQRGFALAETSIEGAPGILQFRRPSNSGQSDPEKKNGLGKAP